MDDSNQMMGKQNLEKKPVYKQIWFWLIIIGVIILIIGLIFFFTKWISNNLITLLIAGLGLILVVVGVIWIFVSNNQKKKKMEEMRQMNAYGEEMPSYGGGMPSYN